MKSSSWLVALAWLAACAHSEEHPLDDDDFDAPRGGQAAGGKGGALSGAGKGGVPAGAAGRATAGQPGAGGRAGSNAGGTASGGVEPMADGGAEASAGTGSAQVPTELAVAHKTGNVDPNDNQIRMGLRISSSASGSAPLSSLALRYYFTSEVAPPLSVEIYDAARDGALGYQAVSKDAVKADVATSGYLELTFTEAAGVLGSGDTLSLDIAIHGPNWTGNFSEADDYSFAADHADFVVWEHVTLSNGSEVVWGNEPP